MNYKEENTQEDMQDSKKQPQEQAEELEQVNEARQNHKNDLDDSSTEEEKLRAEIAELNNKYVRLYAEFDNFKRRTTKERIDLLQTAGKDVVVGLLPIIDDFERALKAMETATDINAVKEGVELVYNKLKSTLSQKGLKEMESKEKAFDSDLHEAITNVPAPTEDMKGKVVDVLEKGYYLNDKVIRFAKVVVGA